MISGDLDEHTALVALLRAQPDGLSWPEMATELLEVGSEVEALDRHTPICHSTGAECPKLPDR